MKKYFIVLVSLVLLASCTSKSGQLDKLPLEKVVVIDVRPTPDYTRYQYKVKRIEKGVTDYIYDINRYEVGDTILKRFQ